MFGMFEAFANRVNEQTKEYVELQENVRQRAVSALIDPFQALQPAKATVQSTTATELVPPKLPAERRSRRKTRPAAKKRAAAKRPALNFA